MAKPLTAPLAQVALSNARPNARLHSLPPPSGPDRGFVAPPEKKRKKTFLDPQQKAIVVARVKTAFNAEPATPKSDIIERVSKEMKLSSSLVKKLLKDADAQVGGGTGKPALKIEITGLEEYVVEITGLEEYVEWVVRRTVRKALGG